MANNYYPIFLSILQSFVEPRELSLHILLASIWIYSRILTIRIDERCGIEEYNANGSITMIEHLSIIFRWHHPATAHFAIVHKCLCVATIFMVATNRKPIKHQVGMRIYQFVVCHPKRVLQRSYTIKMMDITNSKHTLRVYHSCHLAHKFGNRLLVVIAISAHIVGHIEGNVALQFFPFSTVLCLHL